MGYDSSGTTPMASALKSMELRRQSQLLSSPVPMFSKRYWLYGLLFSTHSFLCSPFSDHAMSVTVFSVVHSSRLLLRALSRNCFGCCVSCV